MHIHSHRPIGKQLHSLQARIAIRSWSASHFPHLCVKGIPLIGSTLGSRKWILGNARFSDPLSSRRVTLGLNGVNNDKDKNGNNHSDVYDGDDEYVTVFGQISHTL